MIYKEVSDFYKITHAEVTQLNFFIGQLDSILIEYDELYNFKMS